jgi:hypothetical protein
MLGRPETVLIDDSPDQCGMETGSSAQLEG